MSRLYFSNINIFIPTSLKPYSNTREGMEIIESRCAICESKDKLLFQLKNENSFLKKQLEECKYEKMKNNNLLIEVNTTNFISNEENSTNEDKNEGSFSTQVKHLY